MSNQQKCTFYGKKSEFSKKYINTIFFKSPRWNILFFSLFDAPMNVVSENVKTLWWCFSRPFDPLETHRVLNWMNFIF